MPNISPHIIVPFYPRSQPIQTGINSPLVDIALVEHITDLPPNLLIQNILDRSRRFFIQELLNILNSRRNNREIRILVNNPLVDRRRLQKNDAILAHVIVVCSEVFCHSIKHINGKKICSFVIEHLLILCRKKCVHPHGNLCKEYVEGTTLIRSYRESPHTDVEQTIRFVCSHLLELLEHRRSITPVYRKLPLILGGEQSVSADEPVRSINQYMDEMEKDDRILSASWHVGYIRHDTDVAGCGVVVIPSSNEFRPYAEQKADELAAYVWDRRHEFHYTGLTQEPDEALQTALHCTGKPAFLTDSGDNTTSGAMGANTWVLRQVLAKPEALQGKRVLFAAIQDPAVYTLLAGHTVGDTLPLTLGMGLDSLTEPVQLTVTLKHLGRQEGTVLFAEHGDFGGCATVSVEGLPIDVIVTDTNHPFVERHQTLAAGVDWMDYDVVIVKTGYAFPEPTQQGALCVMSLTDGATLQDTRRLPFKRIMRPMFPVDDI